MKIGKRLLSTLLACLLLLTASCGKEPSGGVDMDKFSSDGSSSQPSALPLAAGSYSETELLALTLKEGESVTPLRLEIGQSGSIDYTLEKRGEETLELRRYCGESGSALTRQEAFWENALRGEKGSCRFLTLIPDGSAYACMTTAEDNKIHYSFLHITPNGTIESISLPADWDPSTVAVTKTGKWIAGDSVNQDTISWFDAPGGKKLGETSVADRLIHPYGDYLAAISTAGNTRELAVYDLNTGEVLQRQEVSNDAVGKQITAVGFGEDSVLVAGNKGLCRLGIPNGTWEKRIASGAFSFFATSKTSGFLREDADGNLYMVTNGKLLKLSFDPNGTPKTGTPFQISTMLAESYTLRGLVEEFQLQHPELDVQLVENLANYSSGDSPKSFAGKWKQAVEELETELAAGDGPDLLILEELPVSLLDKGYFIDLNGKISLDGLLPNIMDAYEREGIRYALPMTFTFPFIIGTQQSLVGHCSTIKEMCMEATKFPISQQYLDPRSVVQKNFLYLDTAKEQAELLYPLLQPSFKLDSKTYDTNSIQGFLQYGRALADICTGGTENSDCFYLSNLLFDIRRDEDMGSCLSDELRIRFANQLSNFYEPVEQKTYLSFAPGAAENGFLPSLGMAIPNNNENQEAALTFINFALSQEGQSLDAFRYRHLSVRENLLVEEENRFHQGLQGTAINFEDGSSIESSNQVSPTPLELIRSLKTPIFIDRELMDAICWPATEYWRGAVTLEEAMQQIEEGLNAISEE